VQIETTIPSDPVRIPARTRQRAMDWSLVLASQGIEAVIRNEPADGWQLHVPATEGPRALAAIAQYRHENRRWRWRQSVWQGQALFDWSSVLWVLLTAVFFGLNSPTRDLRMIGLMDSTSVAQGEWWRLFTATVLHADRLHFAGNAVFGLILIGLAMGRYGTGMGLLAAYLAGVGGNVFSWWLHGEAHRALGASGVVMGALGLLVPQSVTLLSGNPRALRLAVGGLSSGIMLFVLLGLNPGSDVAAHFGGFLTGVILGFGLAQFPRLTQRPWFNWLAGILFLALVAGPWILALRAHG